MNQMAGGREGLLCKLDVMCVLYERLTIEYG